ncbi:hypothetical protein [Sporosarcina jiandibaonis]|uniref:hypothetical protein n=1 Tax=Sporosarcina jiandibaonis TaxID=2715535 RepID=UPI001554F447|nr:hypothetical protein [Sporosarcina jiandibaonis]
MTLILGVTYNDFILVSSDSKVVERYYDGETFEAESDTIREADFKSEKVIRIADKVLLSTSGWYFIGNLLEKKLRELVNKNNDLIECANIIKDLISNLKEGKVTGLSEEDELAIKLMNSKNFSGYLFGFTHSGVTGLVDVRTENFIEMPSDERKGYPSVINGPEPEHDFQYRKAFFLPVGERTIENFVERMVFVHAHLSKKHHELVSTDCNFDLLQRNGDHFEHKKFIIDTIDIYERLGLKP